MNKRILKASPRGFCLGVSRAVKILEDTITEKKENTVYVRKEIVHNTALVEHFKSLGVIIVDEVDEVPEGGLVVFSAHGVSPAVRKKAQARNLQVVDTTCPLVTKVHNEAIRFKNQDCTIILIGQTGHKEVIGITGEAPDNIRFINGVSDLDSLGDIDGSRVAWLSQTTLNVDDTQKIVEKLREMFPRIQDPQAGICYATRNRQLAVKAIANECDLFIVIGSENSSNTKRLAEAAVESGANNVVQIEEPGELINVDFSSVITIGATCGVSVADKQWLRVIEYLKGLGYTNEEERVAVAENNISDTTSF